MKKFKTYTPEKMRNGFGDLSPLYTVEADFIYAQPSGVSTLHRYRPGNPSKSDIAAVVPANLLILEV